MNSIELPEMHLVDIKTEPIDDNAELADIDSDDQDLEELQEIDENPKKKASKNRKRKFSKNCVFCRKNCDNGFRFMKKWIPLAVQYAGKNKNWQPKRSHNVCIKHFNVDKDLSKNSNKRQRLAPSAMPSMHLNQERACTKSKSKIQDQSVQSSSLTCVNPISSINSQSDTSCSGPKSSQKLFYYPSTLLSTPVAQHDVTTINLSTDLVEPVFHERLNYVDTIVSNTSDDQRKRLIPLAGPSMHFNNERTFTKSNIQVQSMQSSLTCVNPLSSLSSQSDNSHSVTKSSQKFFYYPSTLLSTPAAQNITTNNNRNFIERKAPKMVEITSNPSTAKAAKEQPIFLEKLNYVDTVVSDTPDDAVMKSSMQFYKREYERLKLEIERVKESKAAELTDKEQRLNAVNRDLKARLKVSSQYATKLEQLNSNKDSQIADLRLHLTKAQKDIKECDKKWIKSLEPILDEDQINELRGMK